MQFCLQITIFIILKDKFKRLRFDENNTFGQITIASLILYIRYYMYHFIFSVILYIAKSFFLLSSLRFTTIDQQIYHFCFDDILGLQTTCNFTHYILYASFVGKWYYCPICVGRSMNKTTNAVENPATEVSKLPTLEKKTM